MARRRWVYDKEAGELVEVGLDYVAEPRTPMPHVIPDLPDFVSPIDGRRYSGRAGMREHCQIHNVVPTAELKGLPPKPSVQEYKPDRAAIKETLIREAKKRGLL